MNATLEQIKEVQKQLDEMIANFEAWIDWMIACYKEDLQNRRINEDHT